MHKGGGGSLLGQTDKKIELNKIKWVVKFVHTLNIAPSPTVRQVNVSFKIKLQLSFYFVCLLLYF